MITGEVVISAALCGESYGRGVCVEGNNHVALHSAIRDTFPELTNPPV
jgi:hypothetical protein